MRFTESKLEKGVDFDDDKVVEDVLNANDWEIYTLSSLNEHHSLSSFTRLFSITCRQNFQRTRLDCHTTHQTSRISLDDTRLQKRLLPCRYRCRPARRGGSYKAQACEYGTAFFLSYVPTRWPIFTLILSLCFVKRGPCASRRTEHVQKTQVWLSMHLYNHGQFLLSPKFSQRACAN